MKKLFNYRFTVGVFSILAGLLALACLIVGGTAVNGHFEAFSNPVLTLEYADNIGLVKWFNLLDMLGYYLLLLPVIFYFHQQYKYDTPWSSMITFSGLAYVLIGALGAAILAALWPNLLTEYTNAVPEDKKMVTAVFSATTTMVTLGMWNILEVLFAAVWWIGLGKMLYRDSKMIGMLTLLIGLSSLADGVCNMFNAKIVSEIGMNVYLLLGVIWPVAVGVYLTKRSVRQQYGAHLPNQTFHQTNKPVYAQENI